MDVTWVDKRGNTSTWKGRNLANYKDWIVKRAKLTEDQKRRLKLCKTLTAAKRIVRGVDEKR